MTKKAKKGAKPAKVAKTHYLMVRIDDEARELYATAYGLAGEESVSMWARRTLTREAKKLVERAER